MVEHGSLSSLPVVDEASANLGDGDLDGLGRTLDLDDSLRRLGEHLLGRDHSRTRHILDVLDLETLATNDSTQALVVATLGTARDAQLLDTLEGEKKDPFMLHYNFPPFKNW